MFYTVIWIIGYLFVSYIWINFIADKWNIGSVKPTGETKYMNDLNHWLNTHFTLVKQKTITKKNTIIINNTNL